MNYFDNRSANVSAESFNAKVKVFRSQFRGVKNIEFFLFRLDPIDNVNIKKYNLFIIKKPVTNSCNGFL